MEDIEKFRNVDIKKDIKPSNSKKSLIPKLKDSISKTIVENILEEGYSKIKIDQDLLKQKIFQKLDIL